MLNALWGFLRELKPLEYLGAIKLEGWLGIWGAGLSTWIFVRDARKRPRVEVGVHVGPFPIVPPGAPNVPVLLVNMVAGDLPAKVIHVGIRTAGGGWVHLPIPDLPEIKPHQSTNHWWPIAQLLQETQPGAYDGLIRAFATLADGRHFHSKPFRITDMLSLK